MCIRDRDRMMIRGTVRTGDGKECRKRALNDIVISRAGFSRLIGLDVYVNGSFLNAYEGDGIIISTPTGSTGYNLSAGGPIVDPMARLMIITPVCPHSLTSKSIVPVSYTHLEGWKLPRIGKEELAILRLGVYEVKYDESIPEKVAINEAVELAKKYCDASASKFVNALLAKLVSGDKDKKERDVYKRQI